MRRLLWGGAILVALTAHPAGAATPQQDSEEVERTVRTRIEFGRERNEIGIAVRDIEATEKAAAGATDEGAVVTDVRADGPGAAAGLEPGDVIVEFDGERVRGALQLARLVRETPAGRAAPVRVLRSGSPMALSVTPAEAPGRAARLPGMDALRLRRDLDGLGDRLSEVEELTVERDDSGLRRLSVFRRMPEALRGVIGSSPSGRARLGIRAESVGGQLAEYFGTTAGVLVEHVDDGTAGAAAGLRAGDVITAIEGQAVDDLPGLRRQLASLDPGAAFDITVVRDRAETSLTAEPAPEGEEEEDSPRPRRRGSAL